MKIFTKSFGQWSDRKASAPAKCRKCGRMLRKASQLKTEVCNNCRVGK